MKKSNTTREKRQNWNSKKIQCSKSALARYFTFQKQFDSNFGSRTAPKLSAAPRSPASSISIAILRLQVLEFLFFHSKLFIQLSTNFTNSSIPPQPVYDSQPVESTPIRQFARPSYAPAMPLTTAPNIIRRSNPADNPRLPMKKRIRQRHTPSAPVDLTGSVKTWLYKSLKALRVGTDQ